MPPRRRMVVSTAADKQRRLVDKYLLKNEDVLETAARELGIKRTTAYSIIKMYLERGSLESIEEEEEDVGKN